MTGKDFIALAAGILHHSNYKPNNNVLFDHRELIFKNVTIQDIEEIRHFHRENENKIGNGKSAIVVRSQSEWDDIWRHGEKLKTENIVKVFDNFDSAINWIKE